MKSRILYFLFVSLIVLGVLLTSLSTPAGAQGVNATPTPVIPLPEETPLSGVNTINFYQIRQADIQLVGPYDVAFVVFGLPAEWKLNGTADFSLNLNVSLNSVSADQAVGGIGGTLVVEFNREVIGSFPLTQSGDITVPMQIPLEALNPVRDDGLQELVFVLDSGLSCQLNQQMAVTVRTSSNITFPHETILPDTSLARFPFPIYQNSIYPDNALIVVPADPTAEELQSAMAVSAGLGRMSGSRIALDLTSIDKLSPEQISSNNIILVGKAATLPILEQVQFPLAPAAGNFQSAGGNADDGIVQMVNSPWSPGRVVLLVSGNTDLAVVKAAQAVSTGVLRQNAVPNLSIIQQVQEGLQPSLQKTDLTLLELGYSNVLLQRRGVDSATYRFYIPPGMTVSQDAYFELVYGNSALIDYGRSGLVVQVNGQPVGSVRFSDTTAANATNHVQINLPPSVVLPGNNTLEVISNLQPTDNCSIPNLRGLWATIWSESHFHLPLIQTLAETGLAIDLTDYPAPFVFDASLSTTALILPRNDLESWRSALQVAAYLGDSSNGPIAQLKTFYADAIPDSAQTSLNMLVLGLAPQMPIVAELNDVLPAPFESEAGIATERNMQVTFRIPPDSPVGYVEFLPSPWNEKNIVIVAVGNLRQGAAWAASALYESSLRSRLAGNFAVINGQQVTTTDTRVSLPAESVMPTSQPNVAVIPPSVDTTVPIVISRPIWILPALVITLVVIVLILVGVVYSSSTQNKRRGKFIPPAKEDENNKS